MSWIHHLLPTGLNLQPIPLELIPRFFHRVLPAIMPSSPSKELVYPNWLNNSAARCGYWMKMLFAPGHEIMWRHSSLLTNPYVGEWICSMRPRLCGLFRWLNGYAMRDYLWIPPAAASSPSPCGPELSR